MCKTVQECNKMSFSSMGRMQSYVAIKVIIVGGGRFER